MLISTASFASLAVAFVGLLILWSNPKRMVNRVACTCSFHWAIWLGCLHITSYMHGGVFWVRMTSAVGAMLPFHFWMIDEVIVGRWVKEGRRTAWEGTGLLTVSGMLSAICFSSYFIPLNTSAEHHLHGWGYYGYIGGIYVIYAFVLYRTFLNVKLLNGGKRLELQVWLFGGCATAVTIIAAMTLNALTNYRGFTRVQPLFVLVFYAGTAYAITTYRIFDASQVLRIFINKLILILVVAGAAYATFLLLLPVLSPLLALCPTLVVALACAAMIKGWLDRVFEFYPQDTAARQAAYTVAQNESRTENLEAAYLDILRGWGQSDRAMIISGTGGKDGGEADDLTEEDLVARALRQLRWATPERLARERASPDGEILGRFLEQNRLGALVFSETPMLNVVVGVGIPASRRAFTYPQITQLQELAAIIESAFERTLMAVKIQHSEQLATVGLLGASLAHEIRNPLVSVKAIVQLLPSRYQEAEFREKFFRLIGDEVTRIDRLTEQLLDLASPRVYKAQMIDLHPILKSGLDLVSPRAAEKRVRVISDFQASPDKAYTDPAAVTQVLLNLCFNAIQALEIRSTDRCVKVITRNVPEGVELVVSDNGPGLSSEMRKRLFRPFQTTKSSGFGLGLTICRDILAGLKVPIVLDSPVQGQGATFRVTFPCQP
jgi:signal transduction histidine kinase